jgi:hypothetical protein
MYDIELHPLSGAGEVSEDNVVAGHYHTLLLLKVMNMQLTVTILQTAPQFFLCS